MSRGPSFFDRWLEQAGDRLNPILVREVRQWLRSRILIAFFAAMLGFCWLAAALEFTAPGLLTAYLFDLPSVAVHPDGRAMFALYFCLLTVSVCLGVPLTAFSGFSREYQDDAIDILRMTPLRSAQVAWGKFQVSILQMLLYFSAVAPFLCMTYLLRGVDLFALVAALLLLALGGATLTILGLALGSWSRSLNWRAINIALLLSASALVSLILTTFGIALIQFPHRSGDVMAGAICVLVGCSLGWMIGMGIAISNVRPQILRYELIFINVSRLKAIIATSRALTAVLRNEFPIEGRKCGWTPEKSAAFPAHYKEAMALAITLERTIHKSPSYGDRTRYVTYESTQGPLQKLLESFDLILIELGWTDIICGLLYPQRCRMHRDGSPSVRMLTPARLDSIENAASKIELICTEIRDHASQP